MHDPTQLHLDTMQMGLYGSLRNRDRRSPYYEQDTKKAVTETILTALCLLWLYMYDSTW